MMTTKHLLCATAALAALALVGCDRDPQATARRHMERGDAELTKQRLNEAIIEYRRAIQADPRLGPARLQLAIAYASNGDGPNALREYVRAAELMPDNKEAQLKAGNFMLIAGQFEDAKGVADKLLARDAKDVDAQVLLANALAGTRDMEGAVTAFEKALELDPSRAATYSELGTVQLSRGNREEAEAAFRKAVELNPKSASAHLALANYLFTLGQLEPAAAELKTTLQLDADNLIANRAMAMYYMISRKPDAAEPHLQVVAKRSPGPEAKYFLAEYYIRLQRRDDARAVLQAMTGDDATFVGATIRLARIDAIENKNAEAHRLLESVLARESKNIDALVMRGKLQLAENNTANALTSMQTAVDADPRSLDAQIGLGQVHAARGSAKEATAAYNEALKIDGNNYQARMGLARVYIDTGMASDAVPLLLKVVNEQPNNLQARLLLLHGLMAVGDLPQAERQLAVLRANHPDSATVNTAAGMLATIKKDSDGARQAYARALSADPRSYQALAGLLNAEMQSKQFGRARQLIDEQLARMPNDPNVLLMAAQTYGVLGDAFEMEQALKKTVEADPQSLQAYTMLGRMYYQQGRLDLARQELEKYVNTAPASVPGNTMLGTILELQGKKEEAKGRYGKALQVDPRAAVAANNLAWLNATTDGNLDMALQLAQTAKTQLPNRHEVDDTLGWIYYKKGLTSMAIDSLTASATKQPDNPVYNYHLALAYNQSGKKAEARKHLQKALASKKNFENADDARRLLESLEAGGER